MTSQTPMKRGTAAAVLVALVLTGTARADTWACPCGGETYNFDPRDQAHKANWTQLHVAAHCQNDAPAAPNSAVIQSLSPLVQTMFNSIGQSLANKIFGNPYEKQRLQELQRLEQERAIEEARRAAEERRKRQLEIHNRLLSELQLFNTAPGLELMSLNSGPSGGLGLMGFDGRGVDLPLLGIDDPVATNLAPAGTSFFGLGGATGTSGPPDPVVSIRPENIRRAAFLTEIAENAGWSDSQALLDEALRVAEGERPFVAIDDGAVPIVSEDGLKAFQQANIDYRKSRNDHLQASNEYIAVDRESRIMNEALLQERIAATPRPQVITELEAALIKLREQAWKIREQMAEIESKVNFLNIIRRQTILSITNANNLSPDVLRNEKEEQRASLRERLTHWYFKGWRESFSEQTEVIIGKHYGFVDDPALQARLKSMMDRLREISPGAEPVDFKIVDKPKMTQQIPREARGLDENIAAVGNTIYVGRSFMEIAPPISDDELLWIVAHEFSHIENDHSVKQYFRTAWDGAYGSIRQAWDAASTPVRQAWGLASTPGQYTVDKTYEYFSGKDATPRAPVGDAEKAQIQNVQKAAPEPNHTQAHELEADRAGTYLAVAVGVKPEGIRKVLERLDRIHASQIDTLNRLSREAKVAGLPSGQRRIELESGAVPGLSPEQLRKIELENTHPTPASRFEALKKIWGEKLGEFRR